MTDQHPGGQQPSDENDHSTEHSTERSSADAVRTERWPCSGPASLEVALDVGQIEISLADGATEVELELRADPQLDRWSRGLSGLFNRLGGTTGPGGSIRIGGREFSLGGTDFPFGGPGFDLSALSGFAEVNLAAEAVRATEINWSEQARRLTVHSTSRMPLRMVPLVLRLRAPAGSRVNLRTGVGGVTVTGRSGDAEVRTSSGDVELDVVDGDLRLDTGSGTAAAHSVTGRTSTKTGSGNLTLDALDGPAVLKAGSGDIRLGAVRADVQARTGSGNLRVADVERGRLSLDTGSGDLTVAVHAGVAAELDLSSGSGRARSELELRDGTPPAGSATVSIQGSTGSGDVLVTRA
ncbi:MAG TPA: DUF4097 family beta strand repeat-containing protein [Pseudonocardia sp.]|jgi:hypothetical protein